MLNVCWFTKCRYDSLNPHHLIRQEHENLVMDPIYQRFKWLLLLNITILTISSAEHRFNSLRWDSFECHVHPSYVSDYKCSIIQPKRSSLSVELKLVQDLGSVETYTMVSTKSKLSPHYRKLFDITFDGCRVIADVAQSALVAKIYKAVIQSSNQPNRCPIKKGMIYYRNISISEVLPSFVPVSNLLVQVSFSNLKDYYLNVTVKGKIMEN